MRRWKKKGGRISGSRGDERVREKKAPHHLSGGQKKRVAIAGILAMKPDIMVLDEPTTGLDPHGVEQVMNILYNLNQDRNMSIIISSHDVEMVTEFATKIFVLHEGQIIHQAPRKIFSTIPKPLKKSPSETTHGRGLIAPP